MEAAETPAAEKENSVPVLQDSNPGFFSNKVGALLYNASSSTPPRGRTTSKPGLLPPAPPTVYRTPARQQQQQQPLSTAVKTRNMAPSTPALSRMPAPATPKRHNQQPPSAPLATPSAQSSAKKGIEASLEVFARLRPPAEKDADKVESTGRTYKVLEDGTLLQLVPPPGVKSSQAKIYTFKRVFGTEATQEMVFEGAALPLVDGVCTGIQNSLLVMYGMSGGGKTYTTVGSKADVGLLPRALTRIFQKVDTTTTTVAMSFAEIYIDNVYDLLLAKGADEKRAPLKLNKGASASAIVEGLSSTYVSSVDHGLSLFESANEQRVVGATKINSDSSRSHLVCMTALESRGKKRFLWIVDLAGSERGDRTEVEACSTRQGEGSSINKSLSTLFRCFQAMLKKQQFVPFRDSKLTHLLSYLLQGAAAGKTAMIANINPSVADFDETKTVCENAAKARKVKTTVGLNDDLQRQDGGGIWDCNGRRIAWASTVKRPSQKRKDRCYSLVAGAFAERNPRRRRSRSADSTERIRSSHESSRSAGGHGWHAPAREPETGVVDVEDRSQSLDQLAREKELATAAAKEAQRRVVELTEQLGEERRDGEKAQETIAALKGKLRQMDEQLDGSRKVEMELSDALETSEMLERNAREEAQATRAAVAAAGEELVKKGEKARQVAVKEIAALRDELASAKEGEASARGDTMRLQAAMAASEEARVSAVAQVEAFEGEESRLRSVAEAATHDQERLCRAQSEVVGAKAEVGVLKEQLAVALERTSVGEEASERLSRRLEEVSGRLALAEEERVATAGELEVAMRELAGVKGRLAVAEQDSVEAKAAETTAASELESLRQQLSEAIAAESAAANSAQAAAAQADVDLASLKEEVESSKKAMVSQDAHGREVLARLAEAERQAKDASAEAERASTELLSAQDEAARKMAALRDELASSRGNEASVKGEILCLQAAAAASEEARASAVAQVEAFEGEVSQLRGTVEAAAHDEERLSRAQSEAAVAKAEVGALNEQLARAEESRAVTAGQLEVVVGELELVKGGLAVAKEEARAAEATAASELESLRQQLSEATASAVAQVDALEREGSRLRRVAEAAAHDQERLCRAQSEVAGAKAEVGVLKEQLAAAMERASVEQEASESLSRRLQEVCGRLALAEEERVTAGELEVATRELVGVKGRLAVAEQDSAEAKAVETTAASELESLRQQLSESTPSEEARASAVAQVEALEGEVSQLRGTVEAAAHDEERLSRAQSEAAVAKAEVGALNEQLARAEESRAVTAGQLEVVVGELELVKGGLAVAKEEARAAEATAASELESLRQQLSEATASAVAQVDALEREGSRLRRVAEAAAHDQERLCRARSEVAGAQAEVGVLKEQLAAAMERASVEQEARERLMRELDMVNGHLSWAEEERVTAAGELEVATRELVGVKGGLVVAEEAQSELVNLCPRTNKSQREPAAAVAMLASVDHPAAISESMAHPTAAGAQLPQQQQPLSVSDDQDSFAAEYDDIAGEEGRQSFWTQYDDVGGGDESTYLSGSENENEGGGVAIIAQPQGGLKKDIPYEQEEKEEHEESAEEQKDDEHEEEEEEEEEEEQSGNTPALSIAPSVPARVKLYPASSYTPAAPMPSPAIPISPSATPATKPAATPHVSEKDTAPPDRPTSMGDEGKSVGTTTADNSEKKRLAEDLVQSVTTKGVISVIVGVDGEKRLDATLFCRGADIGGCDAPADAELFDGKYFSNICYEVPAGSTCAREGCEWQDESLEHYHLRCGCRTKKNTPLTFKAAATGGITTHEVRAHLLPPHRSDPVQAAGIMSDDDRRRLNICAYHPWPLAHSAHLGKAKPVRLGEEPDWQEAALSLRDEFGAKYTPEECLMEWRRTAYSSVENVGLDWLDVETRRFRRVLMVFSRKPYDNKHIKFDFIAAHLPGRDTAACHRKSVSEKYKRDSGL